jgi:hypothetical protein
MIRQRRTPEQRLALAQRRLRRARAREKKQARADDARSKIIIGAFCKERALRNPGSETRQTVRRGIKRHLALRPRDRYLFVELLELLEDQQETEGP